MEHDVLVKIMEVLPAKALAAAACVSSEWNLAGSAVAHRPRIVSAISLRSNLPDAVHEAVAKVLEAPFRPQFAIVFASPTFSLRGVSTLLLHEFPDDIPVIGCHTAGIMGVDAATDEYKEVFFYSRRSFGIAIVTGYLPGVRVETFSVPCFKKATSRTLSASFSDSAPKALIVLAKRELPANDFLGLLSQHFNCDPPPLIVGGGCTGFTKSLLGHFISDTCTEKLTALNGRKRMEHFKDMFRKTRRRGLKSPRSSKPEATVCLNHDLVGFAFTEVTGDAKLAFEVVSLGASVPVGPVCEVVEKTQHGSSARMSCRVKGACPTTAGTPDYNIVSCRGVLSPLQTLVTWSDSKFFEVEGDGFSSGDDIMFFNVEKAAALCDRDRKLNALAGRTKKMERVMHNLVFACEAREQEFFEEADTDGHHLGVRFPATPRVGMFCTAEIGPHPDTNETVLGLHSHTSMLTVFGWNTSQES